ncbi:25S rRNA (adenine(2142)-N(1))-methyltransferase, Bmt2 [Plasmopara halstedii]|uniref:25S rRNA (Adenine(2142)-N(1))-methyltransferase, Bmt2 n=1 Tax=Plasmopara halstedii TaxID=4781 RepID=A0A0P1AR11_PLAHL|nr:25S rRNA (adenine(2142)-N(1))-methyltransferase, Bmt2 [Plasmopara halstedii]CEG44036.1 25S rRNA (adenine(2142)-N(1))-methyltransferase, Bmt2 [Plasmopara halstedii]|eukprot:XP_024580405.1 25S rRNA (adenine(2142)-N(1))-methyltransferase, Bmt2 [Plasmopara halstedii]
MVLASKLDSKAAASKPASKLIKKTKKSRKALHIAPPRMKSRRKARNVITKFHRLTHELDRLEQQKLDEVETRKLRIAEINQELIELGGRQAYQDASILSTSFHRTSKWVFRLLTRFELRPKAKQPPLPVLEVGAINTQLLSCPWLNVRAIDLKSRHERIEQCDFFSLKPAGEFQIVVSSMVLNCVPGAVKRGQMLRLYREHLMDGGLLFLMLPLLCLRHSKFMTYSRFTKILEAVGFRVRETKDSPKVAFFCLERTEIFNKDASFPHKLLVSGNKRNDFSVVI